MIKKIITLVVTLLLIGIVNLFILLYYLGNFAVLLLPGWHSTQMEGFEIIKYILIIVLCSSMAAILIYKLLNRVHFKKNSSPPER